MSYRVGRHGWLPDPPDYRDWKLRQGHVQHRLRHVLPLTSVGIGAAAARRVQGPGAVGTLLADLRPWCSPIEDQGEIGSCTAQATIGALEYFERKTRGEHVDGSRLFLYRVTRRYLGWEGRGDTGAFVRSAIKSLRLFGTCPERYFPYDESKWDEEPTAYHYAFAQNFKAIEYLRLEGTPDVLRSCLDAGLPFIFGFTCFSSLDDRAVTKTGIIPFPRPRDRVTGGHAVLAVGYSDSHVVIRNSWGVGWGDEGYGYLPWTYFDESHPLAEDCWVLLNAEWVPDDEADLDVAHRLGRESGKRRDRSVSAVALARDHQAVFGESAAPSNPAIKVRAGSDPCRAVPLRLTSNGVAAVDGPPRALDESARPVSLYLRELTLNESFDFALFGEATNELYVLAICWDLSGKPPVVFPPEQLKDLAKSEYRMEKGDTLRFVGDGLQLWPSTKVVGGLYVRVVIMENDDDVREIGKQVERVRAGVESSGLATALIGLASASTGATLAAVAAAANQLTKLVADILQKNGDDLVDVFDGAYGAERAASARVERYDQRGASIVLDFGVGGSKKPVAKGGAASAPKARSKRGAR